MKTRYRIAYAYPTSPAAKELGHNATGCHYIEAQVLREDSTWSPGYIAPGTQGEASATITQALESLLLDLQPTSSKG